MIIHGWEKLGWAVLFTNTSIMRGKKKNLKGVSTKKKQMYGQGEKPRRECGQPQSRPTDEENERKRELSNGCVYLYSGMFYPQ